MLLAEGQRLRQLGPLALAPALNLGEFAEKTKIPTAAGSINCSVYEDWVRP